MLLLFIFASRPGFDISTSRTFGFWCYLFIADREGLSCEDVPTSLNLGGFSFLVMLLGISIGLMFALLKL
jgi:hypothetical protein